MNEPTQPLTIKEAAAAANEKLHVVYHWAQILPEYFKIEPREGFGRLITITRANLEKVVLLRAGYGAKRRSRAYRPIPPSAPPTTLSRGAIQKGWWCRRCDKMLDLTNRLCRCLDGAERPADVERFKRANWEPATVNPKVTLGPKVRA